jgi:hypothetical protein
LLIKDGLHKDIILRVQDTGNGISIYQFMYGRGNYWEQLSGSGPGPRAWFGCVNDPKNNVSYYDYYRLYTSQFIYLEGSKKYL